MALRPISEAGGGSYGDVDSKHRKDDDEKGYTAEKSVSRSSFLQTTTNKASLLQPHPQLVQDLEAGAYPPLSVSYCMKRDGGLVLLLLVCSGSTFGTENKKASSTHSFVQLF